MAGRYNRVWLYLQTVKPVYKDHHWNPKLVAIVDRWSLFRGHLCKKALNGTTKWWLSLKAVAFRKWLLAQVWLHFELISFLKIENNSFKTMILLSPAYRFLLYLRGFVPNIPREITWDYYLGHIYFLISMKPPDKWRKYPRMTNLDSQFL